MDHYHTIINQATLFPRTTFSLLKTIHEKKKLTCNCNQDKTGPIETTDTSHYRQKLTLIKAYPYIWSRNQFYGETQ